MDFVHASLQSSRCLSYLFGAWKVDWVFLTDVAATQTHVLSGCGDNGFPMLFVGFLFRFVIVVVAGRITALTIESMCV